MNQVIVMEEQWCVDAVAPELILSSLFQQESNVRSTSVGVPSYAEDLEGVVLMQPVDQAIIKWSTDDGRTCGQGAVQSDQGSTTTDAATCGQGSWSSEEHGSEYLLGDDWLHEFVLLDRTVRNTSSSSLKPYTPLSPPSSYSEPYLLHTSFTSHPRSLLVPSYLRGVSLNLHKLTQVFVSSAIFPSTTDRIGTCTHSFQCQSSSVRTLSLSPESSATGDYGAHCHLVGNYNPEVLPSHGITSAVRRPVMEGPVAMEANLLSSPSSVQTAHVNLPSLIPASYHQESAEEIGEGSTMQWSLRPLTPSDSLNKQGLPTVRPCYCLLERQRSWNKHISSSQPLQLGPENHKNPVADDWKPETSSLCRSGVFSSLYSDREFHPISLQPVERFQQPRSHRMPQDGNLDTGQTDGGGISDGGLAIINILLRAAEAVDIGNAEMAKVILARLNQHISPTRKESIHRVAHYFRQALITRLMGVDRFATQFSQSPTLTPVEEFLRINAYVRFCEASPYPKFAHFTANQAILEALAGEQAMHIIDFQMGAGAQWASFLQDIASLRCAGKGVPTVRLTAVGTRADEIRATGVNLCHFARLLKVAIEFQAVVTRPECLDVSMLGLRANEAVAGNFIFCLHELLDGGASNGLSIVLRSLLKARAKVVTVVEQEANHSGPCFQQRFSEALQYYTFLFDSLTSSLDAGADSSVNSIIESHLLAPEIMNIVAYDGVARVKRHERLDQWRERMHAVGFRPRFISEASKIQAEKLVNQISTRKGFLVYRDQGSLLLAWQGRPLMAASSWIC